MASRKVKKASNSTPSIPPGERTYLSPDEIEAKAKAQIVDVYVDELGGWVRARLVGADQMISFLRSSQVGDSERVEAIAQLVTDTLCNENGGEFIAKEQAIRLPISTLDNIVGAIAQARKDARGND